MSKYITWKKIYWKKVRIFWVIELFSEFEIISSYVLLALIIIPIITFLWVFICCKYLLSINKFPSSLLSLSANLTTLLGPVLLTGQWLGAIFYAFLDALIFLFSDWISHYFSKNGTESQHMAKYFALCNVCSDLNWNPNLKWEG